MPFATVTPALAGGWGAEPGTRRASTAPGLLTELLMMEIVIAMEVAVVAKTSETKAVPPGARLGQAIRREAMSTTTSAARGMAIGSVWWFTTAKLMATWRPPEGVKSVGIRPRSSRR